MRHLLEVSINNRLFFLLFAVSLSQSIQAAPTTYQMICKGGYDMYATANPLSVNGSMNAYAVLTFKRGLTPRNPAPGECVWLDRPVNANEPNKLIYSAGGGQSFFVGHGGATPTTGVLKYLLKGIMSDQYFYVHVYNDGQVFQVTKLGP